MHLSRSNYYYYFEYCIPCIGTTRKILAETINRTRSYYYCSGRITRGECDDDDTGVINNDVNGLLIIRRY